MTQEKNLPLKIRSVIDSDVPFIFNSWLKSYRETGLLSKNVPNTIYYDNHHKLLQKIWKKSQIFVACSNDPAKINDIYGYIVAERIDGIFVLHYIYVKHTFRKLGIGKLLLNAFEHDSSTASCFTHYTKIADRLAAKFNMHYHPYLIMLNYDEQSEEQYGGDQI